MHINVKALRCVEQNCLVLLNRIWLCLIFVTELNHTSIWFAILMWFQNFTGKECLPAASVIRA